MTSTITQKCFQQENKRSPFQTYLKEIVYGGTDGIITTFAVVAGFTGARVGTNITSYSSLTVLLFGFANLFADGASMGLSNFLSLRSEQDVYKSEEGKELREIRTKPEAERKETKEILIAKGFSKEDAQKLTDMYAKNEKYWLAFMMNNELELPNPTREKPVYTGIATFLSFLFFGFVPLIPYVVNKNDPQAFIYSAIGAFAALVILGIFRFRITKESRIRSVFEIVAVGGLAAVIAYIVGTFFRL